MDLRHLELDFAARRVRVVIGGGRGERTVELDGAAFDRVLAAAAPLVAAAGEGARSLAVDAVARVLEVAPPGGGSRPLDGANWDSLANAIGVLARAVALESGPPRPDRAGSPSEVAFWERAYREQSDGWELGRATPPLARWFAAHSPRGRRALVAGCGRGHEARLLARAGADVVAVDFAEDAVADARALAEREGVHVDFRQGDLFALASAPERYQLAVEHCCFCAIDPARRAEYAEVMAEVLEPGGELVGLFWSHGRPGGPPFSVDEHELRALFTPRFELAHLETPTDSVALRLGQERLVRLVRR